MDNSMRFFMSRRSNDDGFYRFDCAEQAEQFFEEKKYWHAIIATLNYLNYSSVGKQLGLTFSPEGLFPYDSVPNEIKLAHSSVEMTLSWNDGLRVEAPFLKLPADKQIPILRQLAQFNQNVLMQAKYTVEGDEVRMRSECPAALTQPRKMVQLFKELCHNMDTYDDLFVEKFGAQFIHEPNVTRLSDDKVKEIHQDYVSAIDEAIALADQYEKKSSHLAAYFAIYSCFHKLDYIFPLQGFLGSDYQDTLSKSYGLQWHEATGFTKKWLQKLRNMSLDKFQESCYYPNLLFSSRYLNDELGTVRSLQEVQDNVFDAMSSREFDLVVLGLSRTYYKMMFESNIPSNIQKTIEQSLTSASGLPSAQAAEIMFAVYRMLITSNAHDNVA